MTTLDQALEQLRSVTNQLLQEKDLLLLKSNLRAAKSWERQFDIPNSLLHVFYSWLVKELEERVEQQERLAEPEKITRADKEREPAEEHQMAQTSAYYVLQTHGTANLDMVCRYTGLVEIRAKKALEDLVESGMAVKVMPVSYCLADPNDRIPRQPEP